jgi:hypothetical protein
MEKTPIINPICLGDPPSVSRKRGRRLNTAMEEKAISTRKCMARTTRGKVLSSMTEIDFFMWERSYSV